MTVKTVQILAGITLALALAGCSTPIGGLFKRQPTEPAAVAQTPTDEDARPETRPETAQAPLTAETATNVTAAEIAKATKPTERPEQDKGTTIASLGLLEQDGFWLSTPLVKSEAAGRVVVEASGAAVNVTLRPNGAAAGSGSQLSIAAMQVLGIPITDLVEVRVFIR